MGPTPPAGQAHIGWGTPDYARRMALHTAVPTLSVEDFMPTPPTVPALPQFPGGVFSDFVNAMNRDIARSNRTPEQEFADLDVKVGDRVRLTQVNHMQGSIIAAASRRVPKDAAVLEGKVIGTKVKGGKTQLRIAGFDHTGPSHAGGQHIWFPVEDYRVEVLHKVYRLTEEDRLIAAVANISEDRWTNLTDDQRENRRRDYAARAERVKKLLQNSNPTSN